MTFIGYLALIICLFNTIAANSKINDFILYFDEWRFDWDNANDFDNDYHEDWADIIHQNGDKRHMHGCTHNLQTINKKLCVLQTSDGDFAFRFKQSNQILEN